MGLQLRNKAPKRRVKAKLREDRQSATRPNETWAIDFVHDQVVTGRKLRVLTIIDTFSRFSPAIEPRFNFRGPDVAEILEEVGRRVGFPKAIRVDQGTEFVSRDLDLWAYQRGVINWQLHFRSREGLGERLHQNQNRGAHRCQTLNCCPHFASSQLRRWSYFRKNIGLIKINTELGKAPFIQVDRISS
jgi:transposase InsO family protein